MSLKRSSLRPNTSISAASNEYSKTKALFDTCIEGHFSSRFVTSYYKYTQAELRMIKQRIVSSETREKIYTTQTGIVFKLNPNDKNDLLAKAVNGKQGSCNHEFLKILAIEEWFDPIYTNFKLTNSIRKVQFYMRENYFYICCDLIKKTIECMFELKKGLKIEANNGDLEIKPKIPQLRLNATQPLNSTLTKHCQHKFDHYMCVFVFKKESLCKTFKYLLVLDVETLNSVTQNQIFIEPMTDLASDEQLLYNLHKIFKKTIENFGKINFLFVKTEHFKSFIEREFNFIENVGLMSNDQVYEANQKLNTLFSDVGYELANLFRIQNDFNSRLFLSNSSFNSCSSSVSSADISESRARKRVKESNSENFVDENNNIIIQKERKLTCIDKSCRIELKDQEVMASLDDEVRIVSYGNHSVVLSQRNKPPKVFIDLTEQETREKKLTERYDNRFKLQFYFFLLVVFVLAIFVYLK